MKHPFEYQPGSPAAIALGCTCPPRAGRGDGTYGGWVHVCYWGCPMHGAELAQQTTRERVARLIRHAPKEQDNEPRAD